MTESALTNSLQVKKIFSAPIEIVFAHFTKAELLSTWHSPNLTIPPKLNLDLKVGGAYRIEMIDADGDVHIVVGIYKEIVPNQKLVYSWKWEGGTHPETTVTVLFTTLGDSTEVELIHAGFVDDEVKGHHNQGWNGLLSKLANVLT